MGKYERRWECLNTKTCVTDKTEEANETKMQNLIKIFSSYQQVLENIPQISCEHAYF